MKVTISGVKVTISSVKVSISGVKVSISGVKVSISNVGPVNSLSHDVILNAFDENGSYRLT